jgi:hypothetical protein
MSESQFGTEALLKRKRVMYEGTDVIREGMPVAYNYDTLNNINGLDTGVQPNVKRGTTTDGGQNEGKLQRVELLTVDNAAFFAGVVAGTSFAGITGTGNLWIDIYVANGAIMPIRTDKSITIKDKLYLEAGEQTVVNDSSAMPCVGVAVETIDRSGTVGLVLAKVDAIKACDEVEVVTAASRTAVQLPTAAIWENFNLKELKENPFAGALVDEDYRRGVPANSYSDTTANISVVSEAVGALQLLGSADNDAVEIQYAAPITASAGKKWAMECRLKTNTVTADDIGFFFGLLTGQELTGDLIADNGAALIDSNALGFMSFHADSTGVDAVYVAVGETPIIHDADIKALTVNVYTTLGMYFDGTDIQIFVDGVNTGDPILAADIIAGGDDFPQGAVMVPTLCTKNGAAEDDVVIYDWARFAQEA